MEFFLRLSEARPEFVWGLVSRGIALSYFISFASLSWQVLPTAGKNGITPIAESLGAIERDFPRWKRFVWFPSLLWIHRGDALLAALPWLGMLAAGAAVVGGTHAPLSFAVMYVVYLSLDRPMVLVYPWDCMLFEAGFWGMFLPPTHLLPNVTASAAPLPVVAWVFRLLVFRVMFGFGKHKFIGKTPEDTGFLKSFFVNQPLPTPLGWLVQKLPMSFHKAALVMMFLVEIPLPFVAFAPGPWSAVGAVAFAFLMLGIWATGNFGYFNLAVIALAPALLDTKTALAFRFSDLFAPGGSPFVSALALVHTFLAFVSLPLNTFCAQTWMMWPLWRRMPAIFSVPVTIVRAFHPLRWVHAYGVFPPKTPPAGKVLPIIEATWDGAEWLTVSHKYSPTLETSPPKFCAPHQNRLDQATVYEGLGIDESSAMRNFMGRWDPYGYGGTPAARGLLRRMVAGTVPSRGFYDRTLERRHGAPRAARARTYFFEPATLAEARTGKFWRRTLIGPHFAPVEKDVAWFERPLPPPELWHFDDIVWLRRSGLGGLMRRAAEGEDAHSLVMHDAPELEPGDIDRFWNEVLPESAAYRRDWTGLRGIVTSLRRRHGEATLYRLERIAARYTAFLFERLEPLFLDGGMKHLLGNGPATLDVQTSFHVRLLCQHIVGEGRAAYDAVMRDPMLARDELGKMTMQSGAFFQALFQYETVVFQSQKLRLLKAYDERRGRKTPTEAQRQKIERLDQKLRRLFSVFDYGDFLRTQFLSEEDVLDVEERLPVFALKPDGEVVRVAETDSLRV